MPLRPMSAIWVRAQAFGQPLMLMVMRHVEVAEPLLQLVDQRDPAGLGLDDGQLAELDAGAGHHVAPEGRRLDRQARARPARRPASRPGPASTSRMTRPWSVVVRIRSEPCACDQVGELGQQGAGHPADGRVDPDVEPAVVLRVHADVVARAGRDLGRRAVDQRAASGTRSPAPRGTSRRPSRRPGTSAGPGCAAAGSRSRGRSRRRRPRRPGPRPAAPRRPAAGPASGWWTARRRPTGRSRGRARGGPRRRTRRRGSRGRRPAAASRRSRS